MLGLRRRRLLVASNAVMISVLAGCATTADQPDTASSTSSREQTDSNSSLTDWTSSVDCEGEPDAMHDSVIKVEEVTENLGPEYDPIQFSSLSAAEQSILKTVVEDGGYATCEPSDAFEQFVDRVQDRSHQSERMRVYLEREGTYYRLYVEVLDEVYAT